MSESVAPSSPTMSPRMKDERVETVIEKYNSTFKTAVAQDNVIDRVVALMQWFGSYSDLTGGQKKSYVISTLELIIREAVPNNTPEFEYLENILLFVVPKTIYFLIETDSKRMKINPKVSRCLKLCLGST